MSVEESRQIRAYLDALAAVNRTGSDVRLQVRWYAPGVPYSLWDARGNPSFLRQDAEGMMASLTDIRQKLRQITPVPSAAAEAQAAVIESVDATLRMLAVHRDLLVAAEAADAARQPRPPRAENEPTLRSARGAASQATERAERLISDVARTYELSKGPS